jgi:serine O-acetyltransferase
VVSSAPPYSTIVGIPGKVVEGESTRQDVAELDHVRLPDPVARAIGSLVEKLNQLGVRFEEIEERQDCLEDKMLPALAPTNGAVPSTDSRTEEDRQKASSKES